MFLVASAKVTPNILLLVRKLVQIGEQPNYQKEHNSDNPFSSTFVVLVTVATCLIAEVVM